jgi:oligopeptide transport system ATP-binding protein
VSNANSTTNPDQATTVEPFLRVRGLTKHFDVSGGFLTRLGSGRQIIKAVDDVSFDLPRTQTLAVVGESGSGKTTMARLLARLLRADRGSVSVDGEDILKVSRRDMKRLRKEIQIIFQDPFSSLNPRMRTVDIVGRSLAIHMGLRGKSRREQVVHLLESVGLASDHVDRFPHEFSGGQRQRIAVARALASEPSLLLADEPTSALDVSVQAQVLDLLQDLKERLHLTMIFITHDLDVAEFISDSIAVMYGGKIVEIGPADKIFQTPLHPYTQSLLQARPQFTKQPINLLAGEPTVPVNPPPGCRFAHRCPIKVAACEEADIPLETKAPGHAVACIRA